MPEWKTGGIWWNREGERKRLVIWQGRGELVTGLYGNAARKRLFKAYFFVGVGPGGEVPASLSYCMLKNADIC